MSETNDTASLDPRLRLKIIIKTSTIGIIANILLAAFKALAGLLAHSIAMTLDSVNNLTDAISSIVTLVGTSLAGRAPDKEHPLGHGRIEYLAQTIVAAIILYAGISSLVESVKKIIHPDTTNYSFVTFTVLIVAIIVKLILGTYTGRVGKAMNSGSLSASGKDAMFDAVISTSVLASAIINIVFGLNLEAYVGVAIAIIIIKSGIDTIREGMNEIIGIRISPEISQAVKKTICEDERVIGAYDLVLNNYGPELLVGSVHVEIDDRMTATEIDAMERDIAEKVYAKHHIIMTAVGIYAQNKKNPDVEHVRTIIKNLAEGHDGVIQIHGFFMDPVRKKMRFDLIIDFAIKDRDALYEHIYNDVQNEYPDYDLKITLDSDITD